MRKLTLSIEDLQVESFSVDPETGRRGTVHGQGGAPITIPQGEGESFDYCDSVGTCPVVTNCCAVTWKNTCPVSCGATAECGNSCFTWWCNTCASCQVTCNGESCTDICMNCGL